AGRLPDAAAAAVQPDTLAWSPDGRLLAFVGAQDGPSADLYLFDTASGKARRLTAGLNQVASPAWSPDGQWVFFQEVISFGSTQGWKMGSVWAAAADHNEARKLYTPPSNSTREVMLGWSAADTLLTGTRAPDGLHDLRAVPVSGRFVNPIYGGPLDLAAFDPTSQALAFTETAQTGAGIGLAAGLYRLAGLKGSPQLVQAGNWTSLEFSPALKRFLAGGEQGLLLFDPGGSTLLIKNEAAGLPSPDGHWLAAWGSGAHPGLRLYQPDGTLLQQVSADAVAQLSWQPDSKAFYFLAADRLYRVSFPQAQPVQIDQGVLAGSLAWLGGR
ncbi:MAG TPA: hypothetical protein VF813_08130, partial [Anaerolineaceae bacterium]